MILILTSFIFLFQGIVPSVVPLNYEEEITAKWNEIQRDQLKILLTFPEDDVVVSAKC